jgi:hypothetical protein
MRAQAVFVAMLIAVGCSSPPDQVPEAETSPAAEEDVAAADVSDVEDGARRMVEVPFVVGLDYADAVDVLAELGLRAVRSDVPHASPAFTVVAQGVGEGSLVAEGHSVRLLISAGPGESSAATPEVSDATEDSRESTTESEPRSGPLNGYALVLEHVGFDGQSVDGSSMDPWVRPEEGQPCAGPDSSPYVLGADVVITSGGQQVVGAGRLGTGEIVTETLGSGEEWDRRESLVDAIYDLRATLTEDPVVQAGYRLERAEMRLSDYERRQDGQLPPSFEGHDFVPVYCRLSFSVEVPVEDFYGLTIAGREAGTYSLQELTSSDWMVELIAS